MYTNGSNGNGNGNGSKRTKLSLSDLKGGAGDVATADEEFPELLGESEGTSSQRTTTYAKRENTAGAEVIDDEDTGVDLPEKDEKRGTFKRVVVSLGVAACALLVVAVAGYLWLFSGSRDDTYRVRNPASRNRAEAGAINDNSPQMPTADEIARELNKGGNSNSAANTNQGVTPDAATNNNLSLNSNSPVTDRLPLGDFSATVTPQANAGTLQGTATQNATGQTTQVDSTQR
ncbi:MAG TPA: hypothetical protein VF507_06080, partial [Pyrinomonadaceae bacterium]